MAIFAEGKRHRCQNKGGPLKRFAFWFHLKPGSRPLGQGGPSRVSVWHVAQHQGRDLLRLTLANSFLPLRSLVWMRPGCNFEDHHANAKGDPGGRKVVTEGGQKPKAHRKQPAFPNLNCSGMKIPLGSAVGPWPFSNCSLRFALLGTSRNRTGKGKPAPGLGGSYLDIASLCHALKPSLATFETLKETLLHYKNHKFGWVCLVWRNLSKQELVFFLLASLQTKKNKTKVASKKGEPPGPNNPNRSHRSMDLIAPLPKARFDSGPPARGASH